MKKSTLIQFPLAVCLALVCPAVAAESPVPPTQAALYEQSLNKEYARQDAKAAEALKLAEAGKYDEAIAMYEGEVLEPLKLQSKEVDSWRAKDRLREAGEAVRRLRLEYGDKLMRDAERAYADARYQDTVRLATQARDVCSELTSRANVLISAAQNRQQAAKTRDAVNPEKVDPNLVEKEKKISLLLAQARTLFRNKKFDEANAKVEEAYTINPFNAEAAQMASELYKNYYVYGYRRRQADNAGIFSDEAWQWVEPVFPREVNGKRDFGGNEDVADDFAIQSKLNRIVFKKVRFDHTEITSVVNKLNSESKKEGVIIDYRKAQAPVVTEKKDEAAPGDMQPNPDDMAANPAQQNNNQNAQAGAEAPSEDILVTLSVDNVTLRQLLDYICYLTHLNYTVLNDRVILGEVNTMTSRRYDVSFGVLSSVDNYDKGIDAKAEKTEEAAVESGDGSVSVAPSSRTSSATAVSPDALRKFFKLYGVAFPEGSSISVSGNKLRMTNTEENQRKLRSILQELNVDKPMVQVEVKSVELTEVDMEELGFNWSLGVLYDVGTDTKGKRTGWHAGPGSNTQYNADEGQAALLSMLGDSLNKAASGVDSRIIDRLNIFPDILGSVKPFGSDVRLNLSLTINALDRSDRTEMISAPKVLVSSGETATVTMGKKYYFPESWDDLEVEIEDNDTTIVNGTAVDPHIKITLPTPTFGESQTMGTVFTVTPTVLEDNRIRLNINPRITAYVNKDEYGLRVLFYRLTERGWELDPSRTWEGSIWRPVIATRSLDVQVDVNHGETLVLGGLSSSIANSRLDKIPILADIPFIGRLFQSHSENSTRGNTLIFVTAKLMDASGRPIRNMDSNFGIPDVGR